MTSSNTNIKERVNNFKFLLDAIDHSESTGYYKVAAREALKNLILEDFHELNRILYIKPFKIEDEEDKKEFRALENCLDEMDLMLTHLGA